MVSVTELRIRPDWGFVKFAYLPALAGGMVATKYLWPALLLSFRIAPCGLCVLLARWGHHVEEWLNCKPLLQITETGLRCEDGGPATEYEWDAIVGIAMCRRNDIPPWRTNGSVALGPPFWLAITVRGEPLTNCNRGYLDRERYLTSHHSTSSTSRNDRALAAEDASLFSTDGYIDRGASFGQRANGPADEDNLRTICVWPRQVTGGLFSLMRFAKELQAQLLERAERGEIPSLLPEKKGSTS